MKRKSLLIAGGAAVAVATYLILRSRKTIPYGVKAVKPFDKERYMGHWYEIARLDFRQEKNLSHTTADYSVNADGSISVINRGHNEKTGRDKIAKGKAKFAGAPDEGKLKVSFFGPFYSGYNVIEIDRDYKYALVAGRNHDYLWLLSREKSMPGHVKKQYLAKAEDLGYDINKLVWVSQD